MASSREQFRKEAQMALRDIPADILGWWYWSGETKRMERTAELAAETLHNAVQLAQRRDAPDTLEACAGLEGEIMRLSSIVANYERLMAEIDNVQVDYNLENVMFQWEFRRHWYAPVGRWRVALAIAKERLREAGDTVLIVRQARTEG